MAGAGKTEMAIHLRGIAKMMSIGWARSGGSCVDGQRIRKARGRPREGRR